jgi:hypothetical protein
MNNYGFLFSKQKAFFCCLVLLVSSSLHNLSRVLDEFFYPEGFICFHKNRNIHGGGVFILVKTDLTTSTTTRLFSEVNQMTDVLYVSKSSINLHIITTYHPFWNDKTAHESQLC